MSVNYSTLLVYGYKVNKQMLDELYARNENLYEDFQNDNWAIPADAWRPDSSIYIYGLEQGFIKPGYAIEVPTRRNYSREDFDKMTSEFKKYFPNQKDYICKDYILSCID